VFPVEVTPKGVRHLRRAVSIDRSSLTGLATEILAREAYLDATATRPQGT